LAEDRTAVVIHQLRTGHAGRFTRWTEYSKPLDRTDILESAN
jgi:hypothetical protein